VTLLLDENLSRRLVPALQHRFPGSSQFSLLGLERATDQELCDFAAREGFVICSKDDDFHRLVIARNYQPKLVHLAMGNAGNDQILAALNAAAVAIDAALHDGDTGVVVVG
jgi:predicted nuclease of predicted toxin-antitoxin system